MKGAQNTRKELRVRVVRHVMWRNLYFFLERMIMIRPGIHLRITAALKKRFVRDLPWAESFNILGSLRQQRSLCRPMTMVAADVERGMAEKKPLINGADRSTNLTLPDGNDISFTGLSLTVHTRDGPKLVLDNVDGDVKTGELCCIIG